MGITPSYAAACHHDAISSGVLPCGRCGYDVCTDGCVSSPVSAPCDIGDANLHPLATDDAKEASSDDEAAAVTITLRLDAIVRTPCPLCGRKVSFMSITEHMEDAHDVRGYESSSTESSSDATQDETSSESEQQPEQPIIDIAEYNGDTNMFVAERMATDESAREYEYMGGMNEDEAMRQAVQRSLEVTDRITAWDLVV